MSSKKSDLIPALHDSPPALRVLLSNWWLPGLLLLFPLAKILEDPERVTSYHFDVLMRIGIAIVAAMGLQLINGISGQFSLGHAGFLAVGAYAAGFAVEKFSILPASGEDLAAPRYAHPGGVLLFLVAISAAVSLVGVGLSMAVVGVRRLRRIGPTLSGVIGLLAFIWFTIDIIIAARAGGPRWHSVWSRLFYFAASLYDAIVTHGSPAAVWLTHHLPQNWCYAASMLFALLTGGILAAAAGWVVGLPTLRLRGDYLAIATLGFAEIIRIVITNAAPLGRATGLQIAPYPVVADPTDNPPTVGHYILPWVFGAAIVTTMFIWRLKYSAKGRAIQAVREDEVAARAVGIDNVHHKVIAFVIGAFFGGIAGALMATRIGYINPGNFELKDSITLVVIVTLGGLGSIRGTVIAATILTLLPQILLSPKQWLEFLLLPLLRRFGVMELHLSPRVNESLKWIADRQMVAYALLLVVLMLVKHGDFSGLKPSRFRRPRVAANPAV
jgi:ABC-type branched-subunit amino acid transport system permease subunit